MQHAVSTLLARRYLKQKRRPVTAEHSWVGAALTVWSVQTHSSHFQHEDKNTKATAELEQRMTDLLHTKRRMSKPPIVTDVDWR